MNRNTYGAINILTLCYPTFASNIALRIIPPTMTIEDSRVPTKVPDMNIS